MPVNNYEIVNQTIKQLDDYKEQVFVVRDFSLKLHLFWAVSNLRKLLELHRKELTNENTTGI